MKAMTNVKQAHRDYSNAIPDSKMNLIKLKSGLYHTVLLVQ